jgi:hypothetical protein
MAMNPWREIEQRVALDAGGKRVDVHTRPKQGEGFVYTLNETVTRSAMLMVVLEQLRRIRDASAKRVRGRRFNVWYGTAPDDFGDGRLAVIMVPDRFDYHAWEKLSGLRDLPGYRHHGIFRVAEIEGGPLARYDHGTITGYLAPTAAAPPDAGDVVWRSATVVIPPRQAERKWMLPPNGRASRWHTGETWEENRARILNFVWQLRAPGTYARLAEVTEEHLGIAVREELAADDARFGLLRLGFVRTSDWAVPVGVFLRGDLHEDLSYIVLAHELSHYLFHFPLLYLGALVDELARGVPEAAVVFEAAVAANVNRQALERQADHFASNFLIPPQYDVQRIAGLYSEMGRQPSAAEMAWRFLQAQFPSAVDEELTWTNMKQMTALAAADLAAMADTAETLYARMLKATVDRIEGLAHDPGGVVRRGLDALQATFEEIEEVMTSVGGDRARQILGARAAERDVPESSVPDDLRPERYELLPAASLPAGARPRALHLVPAADNPGGDVDGSWLDRHHPHLPADTIAGWRDALYDDVAIHLYRDEAWQPDPAST